MFAYQYIYMCREAKDEIEHIRVCFVSAKFGPLMIFLKRWFAYNETIRGEMHEYQEKVIA